MAHRIGEFVVAGEISNRKRNSVVGWLQLDDERGIKLDLTGNLSGELAGCHFRFEVHRDTQPVMDDKTFKSLQVLQIGTPGDVTLRIAKNLSDDALEKLQWGDLRGPLPTTECLCLYLEWFGQNGRMVAEIINPQMEYDPVDEPVAENQLSEFAGDNPAETKGSDLDLDSQDSDDTFDPLDLDADDEDPYALFKPGLDEEIHKANVDDDSFEPDWEFLGDDSDASDDQTPDAASGSPRRRQWDEVIPGLDPETKRMYEQWDEIVEGTRDEPLSTMFDPPIELPSVEQVTSEEQAESLIKTLLARLALHGVAIDVCEHYSYTDVYRYLMTEVLPDANIHPNLPATGWVQHYSTWESCPDCEREFEEKYRAENADNPPEADED